MGEWRPKDAPGPGGQDGLRREYLAGRISADAYISAGGDPDVVRDTEAERAKASAAQKAANDKTATGVTLGCIGIPFLLVGGCVAMTMLGGDSDRPDTASDWTYSAERVCNDSVEQQLKDPGSAEYSDVDVTVTDSTGPDFSYRVTGTVRAANSFGGMAVSTFTCTANYTDDDGTMRAQATVS